MISYIAVFTLKQYAGKVSDHTKITNLFGGWQNDSDPFGGRERVPAAVLKEVDRKEEMMLFAVTSYDRGISDRL